MRSKRPQRVRLAIVFRVAPNGAGRWRVRSTESSGPDRPGGVMGDVAGRPRANRRPRGRTKPPADRDAATRARLEQHWAASERGDFDAEHEIYAEDAVLDYPQSGERFRGRSAIKAQRGGHAAERHFAVLRILGVGGLWVSECLISYDGAPTYSVSVMELAGDLVVHERQYFADPFPAPASRAALAEMIPGEAAASGPLPRPAGSGRPRATAPINAEPKERMP